jgi:hypothetical protein
MKPCIDQPFVETVLESVAQPLNLPRKSGHALAGTECGTLCLAGNDPAR